MEKYGFVYIWYDRKRKMYYVGCHWGTEEDGYICSSNRMRDAYRRRPQDFKRRIIERIETSISDTFDAEQRWLNLIEDQLLGKKYYNLCNSSKNHWSKSNDLKLTIGQKISKANKGKIAGIVRSEETRKKMGDAKRGVAKSDEHKAKLSSSLKGRKVIFSEEHRANISKAKTGKKRSGEPWNKGLKLGPQSEETKIKRSNALKGRTYEELYGDRADEMRSKRTGRKSNGTNC